MQVALLQIVDYAPRLVHGISVTSSL